MKQTAFLCWSQQIVAIILYLISMRKHKNIFAFSITADALAPSVTRSSAALDKRYLVHKEGLLLYLGPPFTARSRSREIRYYNDRIALKFDRHLGSAAAEVPVKFQSDWKSLYPNLAASRLTRPCGKMSVHLVNWGPVSAQCREVERKYKDILTFPKTIRAPFQYKYRLPRFGYFHNIIKIRRSWDGLIFIMGFLYW